MLLGDEHVDRGHDEQREERSDGHPADEHDADRIARDGAGSFDEREREVPYDGGDGRHQDRAKAGRSRGANRIDLAHPELLLLVRELDDQNAVLRHQTDQRDETHLRVDVERRRPALGQLEVHSRRAGELQEREDHRAEHGERHRAGQDDERIAERVELRGEHQEDEEERETHRGQEFPALLPELPRLAGVIDAVTRRQNARGGVFQNAKPTIERARSDAGDLDRVELLEARQRARLDAFAQRRDRAERHERPVRTGDVNVVQLLGGEPTGPLYLRDDLVASTRDAEAVDEVAADHRREIGAHLLEAQAHRRDLVLVDHDLGLRLIDANVGDGRKGELATLHRLLRELLGEANELFVARRRCDHELHREEASARQRRRQKYRRAHSRDPAELLHHLFLNWKDGALSLVPRLDEHAAEAAGRERELEAVIELRRGMENALHFGCVRRHLLERGVGLHVDGAEDDALILVGRELLRREHVHRYDEQRERDPHHVDRRPRA